METLNTHQFLYADLETYMTDLINQSIVSASGGMSNTDGHVRMYTTHLARPPLFSRMGAATGFVCCSSQKQLNCFLLPSIS